MKRKICFVINPVSGSGRGQALPEKILASTISKNSEMSFLFTEASGHAYELAKQAASEGFETIVACGGDGTVNEVAQALMGSSCSMGIIPYGSGNGLARHYGIPFKIQDALSIIMDGSLTWHDGVLINGHHAFNVSGIGFDAHIASLFGKNGKRGFNNYLKLIVNEFNACQDTPVEITYNNQIIQCESVMISIAVASQFGNNAFIAPHADTTDNLTDITVVKKMSWVQLLPFALRVFLRKIEGSGFAQLLRSEKFTIQSKAPLPLHIDGEPKGNFNIFEITSIPKAVKIHIPKVHVQ